MKLALLIIAGLGVAALLWGKLSQNSAKSEDEMIGAVIPYGVGAVLLIIDVVLALGYAVFR